MLGQNDGNPYVSPHGRDVQFNITDMIRQYDGNAYLSPHQLGSTIPQVQNPSHIPPQGRISHPLTNVTSHMNYDDLEEDFSDDEGDSEKENDPKQKYNGNIAKNGFQPHQLVPPHLQHLVQPHLNQLVQPPFNQMPAEHTSECNWNNKPGMSDDDNNRNDETDYDESDDNHEEGDVNNEDKPQIKQKFPIVTPPRHHTRRRFEMCRRVLDVQSFEIQKTEFEKLIPSLESTPKSTNKNSKSTLRRLGLQRSFSISKLSHLFRRNKTEIVATASDYTSFNNTSPDLQSSITLPTSTISVEDADSKLDDTNQSLTVVIEKEILESLYFRSIFPEHFLTIQLIQLNVEEVQNIIRQVDHFKSIENKLNTLIFEESLSGPALMCCNLTELKNILDLNLGNWTIFEQLITGLRLIQIDELQKLILQK